MKLLILICSVLSVTLAQEPSISCVYNNLNEIYRCELVINNPNGFNNFTEIRGTHLAGFTDANVTSVYTSSGISRNVPRIICDTFLNVENFDMYNTGLTEIDDTAFSGCSRITKLNIFYNRIESISVNAFATLSKVWDIDLGYNLLTTLPENLFANQQNLVELSMNRNPFDNLPSGLFRPLVNLDILNLGNANLNAIDSEWFSTNNNLNYLYLPGNRINLTANIFAGIPESVRSISLANNGITEIESGTFAGLTQLHDLILYGNNISELQANVFADLDALVSLDLTLNPLEAINVGAFRGLDDLNTLRLSECSISDLRSISFEGLRNLTSLDLSFNDIEEIPAGTFAPIPNLRYIGMWDNRIKTLRRNSFGAVNELRTIDLDGNIVNALDRALIDDAVNLLSLYLNANLCASNHFDNFLNSRDVYLLMLENCFRNLRYIVDTTTEDNGVYAFFEGPQPGIVLRVRSDNEIQIALTPFNFLWSPSIEIFIGSNNNTLSLIRINEGIDVVTVPTPNILQNDQGNDFRIIWANQNVLVFRGNELFPFMSYAMQHFFPVNFYGLRAVETRAAWTVQPVGF